MEEPIRITSLEQLQDWCRNPNSKDPIVLEWILDYFLDDLNKPVSFLEKRFDQRKKYIITMFWFVRFTMMCEDLSLENAIQRCFNNLDYWISRASKNYEPATSYKQDFLDTLGITLK